MARSPWTLGAACALLATCLLAWRSLGSDGDARLRRDLSEARREVEALRRMTHTGWGVPRGPAGPCTWGQAEWQADHRDWRHSECPDSGRWMPVLSTSLRGKLTTVVSVGCNKAR